MACLVISERTSGLEEGEPFSHINSLKVFDLDDFELSEFITCQDSSGSVTSLEYILKNRND